MKIFSYFVQNVFSWVSWTCYYLRSQLIPNLSFEELEIRPYCLINKLIPTKRTTLWVKNVSLNQILDCGHRTRILHLSFFIYNRVLICTLSLLGKYISKKISQLDICNIPYKTIIGVRFNELLISYSSFIIFAFELTKHLLQENFYLFVC